MSVQSQTVTDLSKVFALPEQTQKRPKRLGDHLIEAGLATQSDISRALATQSTAHARLGEILVAQDVLSGADLLTALCQQWQTECIDLNRFRPDAALIDLYGPADCLRDGLVPVQRVGSTTLIATARPNEFARQSERLTALLEIGRAHV